MTGCSTQFPNNWAIVSLYTWASCLELVTPPGNDVEEPDLLDLLVAFARSHGFRQKTDVAGISGGSGTRFNNRRHTERLLGWTRLAWSVFRDRGDSGRAGDFRVHLGRSLLVSGRERILNTFRFRTNPADWATNALFVDRVATWEESNCTKPLSRKL